MTGQRRTKKRILYVITKSSLGGAGRYVLDLATNLPSDRFEAVVALGGQGPLKAMLEQHGIRTISVPHLQRDVSTLKELAVFVALYRIFRDERADIVHLNSSKIGGLGSLAARLARTPLIIFTAHGWYFHEDRGAIIKAITWFLSWLTQLLSHRTITVSEFDRGRSPLPGRAITVHNGIISSSLKNSEAARGSLIELNRAVSNHKGVAWIGTLAELHKNKGLSHLVAAMTSVPNAALIILGEGEERPFLKEQIINLELSGRVFLLGNVSNGAQYLNAFDVFALPSIKEGLPYAVLEAGSASLPVVASDVGGIPEIIEHRRTGLLVPPKDSEALAAALNELLEDAPKRASYGAALKERIEEEFSFEHMVRETLEVYES